MSDYKENKNPDFTVEDIIASYNEYMEKLEKFEIEKNEFYKRIADEYDLNVESYSNSDDESDYSCIADILVDEGIALDFDTHMEMENYTILEKSYGRLLDALKDTSEDPNQRRQFESVSFWVERWKKEKEEEIKKVQKAIEQLDDILAVCNKYRIKEGTPDDKEWKLKKAKKAKEIVDVLISDFNDILENPNEYCEKGKLPDGKEDEIKEVLKNLERKNNQLNEFLADFDEFREKEQSPNK